MIAELLAQRIADRLVDPTLGPAVVDSVEVRSRFVNGRLVPFLYVLLSDASAAVITVEPAALEEPE